MIVNTMKDFKRVFATAIVVLFLFIPDKLVADMYWVKPEKIKFISYLGVSAAGGYSPMIHAIPNTEVLGGGFGAVGLRYQMRTIRTNLTISTGAEVTYLSAMTAHDDFTLHGIYQYRDPMLDHTIDMDYQLGFSNYRERHNFLSVNVPILVGKDFRMTYIFGGVNIMCHLTNNYRTDATITAKAVDPEIIGDIEDVPTHYLSTFDIRSQGRLDFDVEAMGMIEYGVLLDRWLLKVNPRNWGTYKPSKVSYRLGVFASCGFVAHDSNVHDRALVHFDGAVYDGASVTVPMKDASHISNSSIFTTPTAAERFYSTLMVGLRFTLLFQLNEPCLLCTD